MTRVVLVRDGMLHIIVALDGCSFETRVLKKLASYEVRVRVRARGEYRRGR